MSELFIRIVNMSISASWIVLAVLLLRLVLKKAPKWITVALWGIVAVRLICPFSMESIFSLIPSTETISPEIMMDATPEIHSGISVLNNAVNPIITESFTPAVGASINPLQIWIPLAAILWLVGVIGMVIYTAISFWRVKQKVGTAVLLRDNIFQSENVVSPFVLGIIKPKIYLPFSINEQDMAHVIAHENAHIRRKDHLWKPLGFLLLSVHWFNPMMWLGYILLCRDIELACDEKVIKEMDTEQKADYSQALLTCSVNRRMIAACPLAFGEVSVKNRIKSVLNYKKPAFWIIIVAIVISLVVGVCFLTNPTSTNLSTEMSAFIEDQILAHHNGMYKSGEFCCTDFEVLGTRKKINYTTVYMWVLYEEYTDDNGKIEDVSGGHIPTAITLRKSNGQYELIEYWEAQDGSRYTPSIRAKFPLYLWGKATDSQRYIQEQQANCKQKAEAYFASVSNVGGVDEPENNTENYIISTALSYASCSNTSWIFASALNNDKMYISSVQHLPIYKFDTLEDLQQFKKYFENHHSMDQGYDEVPSFNKITANYDEAFFAENSLLLVYIGANNSTHRFGVNSVINNENVFYVQIEETTGAEAVDTAMAGWFITLVVPDHVIQHCIEFDAMMHTELTEPEESTPDPYVIHYPDHIALYEQTPTENIKQLSANEEFVYTKMHYQTYDSKWHCQGYDYLYRLEVTGRMNNAAKNTTYVILCNESITFDQAWKAAGFSSNTEDYFDAAEAMIVGYRHFSGQTNEPAETEPPETTPDNSTSNYKFIVNGQDISQGNYVTDENIIGNNDNMYLPLTAILKCYGAKVNWTSDTVAEITLNASKYILNLSDAALVKDGSNGNFIIPAPGSTLYTKVSGKELYIDSLNLRYVLGVMGINVKADINYPGRTVTVQ